MKTHILKNKCAQYRAPQIARERGIYPYYTAIESEQSTVVKIKGKDVLMFGSNSYLGLSNDPRLKEAAKAAIDKYGTSCSGSRFLNGTLNIHVELVILFALFAYLCPFTSHGEMDWNLLHFFTRNTATAFCLTTPLFLTILTLNLPKVNIVTYRAQMIMISVVIRLHCINEAKIGFARLQNTNGTTFLFTFANIKS